MLIRTGLVALALMTAAPAVQAQTIELGRDGPRVDLRSERQRERDYRRDEYRRDMYRDRDDLTTGSVRRYRDYDDGRRYDRRW